MSPAPLSGRPVGRKISALEHFLECSAKPFRPLAPALLSELGPVFVIAFPRIDGLAAGQLAAAQVVNANRIRELVTSYHETHLQGQWHAKVTLRSLCSSFGLGST